MKFKNSLLTGLLSVLIGVLGANVSSAANQAEENFDANWPYTLWAGSITRANATNTTTGWKAQLMNIWTNAPDPSSSPYRALFPATSTNGSWVMSYMLTNPIGYVQFAAQNATTLKTIYLGVESSYETNAVSWVTNAVVTNTLSGAYTNFVVRNLLNSSSNQYIRLIKYSSGSGLALALDDISISHAAGSVTLSNPVRAPTSPADSEPVSISATVTISGGVDALSLTNYWHVWPDLSWTNSAMTSNSPTTFITASGIPGQPLGAIIEYYAKATYSVDGSPYFSISATDRYTVRPLTSFTNLAITGVITTNMTLTGNYTWQGIVSLSNLTNAAIKLEGTSNGVTTTWGDTNQTTSAMPIMGTAETGTATSIILYGTNVAYSVINFNETNGDYTVQVCSFNDFDSWNNSPFGSYTNSNWILSDGQITNDTTLAYKTKSAILNGSPNLSTNSFLKSPFLTNGIGQISFWYRNWETNATPTGTLLVQVAPSATATVWTTRSTITNIISPNYLFHNVAISDRDNHAVRIVNNPTGNTSRVCLDEVSIAEPGAGVLFTNLVHFPTTPTCTNPVTVQVNLDPVGNAGITNVTLYYRTTVATNSVVMTNSLSTLYTATIPPGQGPTTGAGLVEYYVACAFGGINSGIVSPVYAPLAGPAGPTNFVISRSYLVITNVTLLPNPPALGIISQIAAEIIPRDGASNIIATAFYRVGTNGGFTSNSMIYSGASNRFVTTNGVPAQSVPETPVYYSITATCLGGNPIVPTNYPTQGTNAPLVAYVGIPVFLSSYSNLQVTGSFSTNLLLVRDYTWQGVATLSNAIDATFRFAGINGSTSYWGVASQSISNFPYYGVATNDASTLTLFGTNSGYFMFEFNETNLTFAIRRCNYMNFEQWTNAAPYGAYTNNEGWVLADGRTTTNSPADNLRVFAGAGRSGILQEGSTTNALLQSPYLTNGVGQISLWYRTGEASSLPPAQFSIQIASSLSSPWTTLVTFTNIASQAYLYTVIPHSDISNHYVRILNNTNTAHAALCLDEIVITEPGASVLFTNLTHSPTIPVCTNPVAVAVTITPLAGAVVTNVMLHYRTTVATNSVVMTTAGAGLYAADIPPGQGPTGGTGLVEYYVKCAFQGLDSELVSPLYTPAGGPANPTNFVISRSYLVITNVTLLPTPALINTNIQIAADIIPRDGASNILAWALYRVGFSGGFSSNSMVYSGASNRFVTTNAITAQPVPGTPIYYAITATCQGGNPIVPTNYPALGTNAPLVAYMGAATLLSSYSNLQVTGSFSTNLILVDNYTWQGVATLSNAIDATFRFAGINGGTSFWGITSQTSSNFPYFGTATNDASLITLYGANSGYFVFEFNETNRAFVVRRCNYLNFEQWTNASPYGAYTNSESWVLANGRTTTNSTPDDLLRFKGAGRSGILQKGPPSTNAFLQSPYLTNGVGDISFWYRNAETNSTPPAQFSVQVATSTSSTWSVLATFTNILSQDYLYAVIRHNDMTNHYVRILNNTNASHAALCLDEIVITERRFAVTEYNLTNSPTVPTFNIQSGKVDDVNISIDLVPILDTLITNAVVWFRFGPTGAFASLPMTNSGVHWSTATPIQQTNDIPYIGVVQYAVQYFFAGSLSDTSPTFYPQGGTNDPATFQVIHRSENFDMDWPYTLWVSSVTRANATNTTTGWKTQLMNIWANAPDPSSTPYRALYPATSTNSSWVMSSMLSNGIGSVQFVLRNATPGNTITMGIESSYETNAVSWVTNAIVTNFTDAAYRSFLVTNLLNPASNQIIRLRKYSSGSGLALGIDDIVVSYPPVNVAISNVFINPGYPATGDSVRVSCEVASINPLFTAYGITPTLYYHRPTGSYSNLPMALVSGNRYESSSIPAQPRDTKIEYYIRCAFSGYHGSTNEDRSPQFFPMGGVTSPTNYIVRAFASPYSNVAAVVNGQSQGGRLLSNRMWQSIINLTGTNTFSLSLQGYGYFNGSNYMTSPISWGQTNTWQTDLPLADTAGTGQTAIAISGTFASGQYLVRFDEVTGKYLAIPCLWQDFDQLSDTAGIYKRLDININAQNIVNNFDLWPTNITRTRAEDFGNLLWSTLTTFTNAIGGGDDGYQIFGSRINAGTVQTTNVAAKGQAFVVQPSHWGSFPLRGVGTISYSYKSSVASNSTATVGAYLFPTNDAPAYNSDNFPNDFVWDSIPGSTNAVVTNVFRTTTVAVQTNTAFDIIFSHDFGESVYFDNISVSEWYADSKTNGDWIATDSWIEPSRKNGMGNCCRFDPTRSPPGTNQYLQTPMLTNGIYTFSFQYCGATTTPVSFDILLSDGDPSLFTNMIDSVTNQFDGTGSNYTTYSKTIKNNSTNLFLRFKSTTQAPGVLLMDDFKITPYALGDTWALNNTAIDATDQQYPPAARQFFAGACFLNSNRVSNVSTNVTDTPDTNEMPNVSSPAIDGIGEISFWYRNWATAGSVTPAQLLIQKSPAAPISWTTILTITNIVNTNDYLFFQSSVYDTNRSMIRICNDDTYATAVGRVCLDDVLITAPMASYLSMSNLTITPAVPLSSNTVKVAVDVYHLFLLDPANLTLTAAYGTGSTYSALASADFSSPLLMTCIATNFTVPGRSYRYETVSSIPSLPVDTFVKYESRANFDGGYHPEIFSPTLNKTFPAPPTWYTPLPTTGMTYYVVFSCTTGSVWINEVNYGYTSADKTNEYVELCGLTGADVRGWSIWLANSSTNIYGAYTITNQNAFGNPTNGYGFWTLGDSSVLGKSMVFTNAESAGNHLYVPGGIRLLRSNGSYADSVCYGIGSVTTLTNAGFKYIGRETSSFANSSLFQTGTVGALYWVYTTLAGNHHTPSQVNESQWFPANGEISASPTVTIVAVWMNTNVWIECSSTNFWLPTPWYSTNLMNSNGWTNVAPFWSTYPTLSTSNTYTLHFAPLSNNPVFFKIITTNAP